VRAAQVDAVAARIDFTVRMQRSAASPRLTIPMQRSSRSCCEEMGESLKTRPRVFPQREATCSTSLAFGSLRAPLRGACGLGDGTEVLPLELGEPDEDLPRDVERAAQTTAVALWLEPGDPRVQGVAAPGSPLYSCCASPRR